MSLKFDTRKATSRSSPLWKSVRVDTVGSTVLRQRTRKEAGPAQQPDDEPRMLAGMWGL